MSFELGKILITGGAGFIGSHIPIKEPNEIIKTKPDYVLILPWNLKNEIMRQMKDIHKWGGKFVIPIPKVRIVK